MVKFDSFIELVNGAIIQEDAHLAHKAEKKRKAQQWDLLAVLPRGSVWCSRAHSEPLSAPATAAVGIQAPSVHTATGDIQASCSSAE